MDWKEQLEDQLKEASRRRRISGYLKNLANLLLESDTRFNLVYSSSRDVYFSIILREEPNKQTSKKLLKNYGRYVLKYLKNSIR